MMMSFESAFEDSSTKQKRSTRVHRRSPPDRNLLKKPKYNLNVHLNRNECSACTAIYRDNVSCLDDGLGKHFESGNEATRKMLCN